MQELYRFQKHSMLTTQTEGVEKASVQTQPTAAKAAQAAQDAQAVELDQPPLAPPVALYANLPTEWPLARISVYTRHIGLRSIEDLRN